MLVDLGIVDATIALVPADETFVADFGWPELRIHFSEEPLQHLARERVQHADVLQLETVVVVQGDMVHVHAHHILGKVAVPLREQHVCVPERIDDVGDGVRVVRVEQCHGVVLLQRQDAPLEVIIVDDDSLSRQQLSGLLLDRLEVLRVDATDALRVEGGDRRPDDALECTHGQFS